MLLTAGLDQFLTTVAVLARMADEGAPKSEAEFNKILYPFAAKRYPRLATNHQLGEPTFIEDIEDVRLLVESFANDSMLDDLDQSKAMSSETAGIDEAVLTKVRSAVVGFIDSSVYRLPFRACINYIFSTPSTVARGGSTSELPGVMWVNPRAHWVEQDVIELLVHELAHTMLFMDEMVYRHYDYEQVANREFWARSSILRVPRPLDKVVHSIVVASELVACRTRIEGFDQTSLAHGPTEFICKNALISIQQTLPMAERGIITPRVVDILNRCEAVVTDILKQSHPADSNLGSSSSGMGYAV